MAGYFKQKENVFIFVSKESRFKGILIILLIFFLLLFIIVFPIVNYIENLLKYGEITPFAFIPIIIVIPFSILKSLNPGIKIDFFKSALITVNPIFTFMIYNEVKLFDIDFLLLDKISTNKYILYLVKKDKGMITLFETMQIDMILYLGHEISTLIGRRLNFSIRW